MIRFTKRTRLNRIYRILSIFTAFHFIASSVIPPQFANAQSIIQNLNLPLPGQMISLTPGFKPTLIQGISLDPVDPLKMNFIVNTGDTKLQGEALKKESMRLIKYFLASLTVSDNEFWVNLSPV